MSRIPITLAQNSSQLNQSNNELLPNEIKSQVKKSINESNNLNDIQIYGLTLKIYQALIQLYHHTEIAFKILDFDNDGIIEFKDFHDLLKVKNIYKGDGILRTIFSILDLDGDGKLNYNDWRQGFNHVENKLNEFYKNSIQDSSNIINPISNENESVLKGQSSMKNEAIINDPSVFNGSFDHNTIDASCSNSWTNQIDKELIPNSQPENETSFNKNNELKYSQDLDDAENQIVNPNTNTNTNELNEFLKIENQSRNKSSIAKVSSRIENFDENSIIPKFCISVNTSKESESDLGLPLEHEEKLTSSPGKRKSVHSITSKYSLDNQDQESIPEPCNSARGAPKSINITEMGSPILEKLSLNHFMDLEEHNDLETPLSKSSGEEEYTSPLKSSQMLQKSLEIIREESKSNNNMMETCKAVAKEDYSDQENKYPSGVLSYSPNIKSSLDINATSGNHRNQEGVIGTENSLNHENNEIESATMEFETNLEDQTYESEPIQNFEAFENFNDHEGNFYQTENLKHRIYKEEMPIITEHSEEEENQSVLFLSKFSDASHERFNHTNNKKDNLLMDQVDTNTSEKTHRLEASLTLMNKQNNDSTLSPFQGKRLFDHTTENNVLQVDKVKDNNFDLSNLQLQKTYSMPHENKSSIFKNKNQSLVSKRYEELAENNINFPERNQKLHTATSLENKIIVEPQISDTKACSGHSIGDYGDIPEVLMSNFDKENESQSLDRLMLQNMPDSPGRQAYRASNNSRGSFPNRQAKGDPSNDFANRIGFFPFSSGNNPDENERDNDLSINRSSIKREKSILAQGLLIKFDSPKESKIIDDEISRDAKTENLDPNNIIKNFEIYGDDNANPRKLSIESIEIQEAELISPSKDVKKSNISPNIQKDSNISQNTTETKHNKSSQTSPYKNKTQSPLTPKSSAKKAQNKCSTVVATSSSILVEVAVPEDNIGSLATTKVNTIRDEELSYSFKVKNDLNLKGTSSLDMISNGQTQSINGDADVELENELMKSNKEIDSKTKDSAELNILSNLLNHITTNKQSTKPLHDKNYISSLIDSPLRIESLNAKENSNSNLILEKDYKIEMEDLDMLPDYDHSYAKETNPCVNLPNDNNDDDTKGSVWRKDTKQVLNEKLKEITSNVNLERKSLKFEEGNASPLQNLRRIQSSSIRNHNIKENLLQMVDELFRFESGHHHSPQKKLITGSFRQENLIGSGLTHSKKDIFSELTQESQNKARNSSNRNSLDIIFQKLDNQINRLKTESQQYQHQQGKNIFSKTPYTHISQTSNPPGSQLRFVTFPNSNKNSSMKNSMFPNQDRMSIAPDPISNTTTTAIYGNDNGRSSWNFDTLDQNHIANLKKKNSKKEDDIAKTLEFSSQKQIFQKKCSSPITKEDQIKQSSSLNRRTIEDLIDLNRGDSKGKTFRHGLMSPHDLQSENIPLNNNSNKQNPYFARFEQKSDPLLTKQLHKSSKISENIENMISSISTFRIDQLRKSVDSHQSPKKYSQINQKKDSINDKKYNLNTNLSTNLNDFGHPETNFSQEIKVLKKQIQIDTLQKGLIKQLEDFQTYHARQHKPSRIHNFESLFTNHQEQIYLKTNTCTESSLDGFTKANKIRLLDEYAKLDIVNKQLEKNIGRYNTNLKY